MKKYLFITILFLCGGFANSQTILDELGKDVASKISNALKSQAANGQLKVAVLSLYFQNIYSDTIPTEMGVRLRRSLEQQLQIVAQKRGINIKVLTNNSSETDKVMDSYFVPPSNASSDYWAKHLNNIAPDYFVEGKFEISPDYSQITVKQLKIKPNKNNTQRKVLAVENVTQKVRNKKDKSFLLGLQTNTSIEDLSEFITLQLKFQTNVKNIRLSNFTFEKTNMPSKFSDVLTLELQNKLASLGEYSVSQGNTRSIFGTKTPHTLYGHYYIENDRLKLIAFLRNAETKKTVSSVTCWIDTLSLTNRRIKYRPENVEKAMEVRKEVEKADVKNSFNIDIWTNKGDENLIFKENETIQLYVMADKKCFMRFLYILADGTTVLLLDNYEVTQDLVGKEIKIPDEFYCTDPYGGETLMLCAQTKKFDELNTKEEDGYEFVLDNLKTTINSNRRGLKKRIKYAETYLNIVTMKK